MCFRARFDLRVTCQGLDKSDGTLVFWRMAKYACRWRSTEVRLTADKGSRDPFDKLEFDS